MDEEPRRGSHLLDAAVEVVADGGIAALSMRSVATAAGVSLAQVQYYFRTKEQLVAAAFEHVSADVERRASLVDPTAGVDVLLRELLEVWLPLDEPRAKHARVWLAFTAAAATSPALMEVAAQTDTALREAFTELLADAQLDADLDPAVEAAVLLAVVDGLVVQALVLPPRRRRRLLVDSLDGYLRRLLGERE